jgi:hypothetical protein
MFRGIAHHFFLLLLGVPAAAGGLEAPCCMKHNQHHQESAEAAPEAFSLVIALPVLLVRYCLQLRARGHSFLPATQ